MCLFQRGGESKRGLLLSFTAGRVSCCLFTWPKLSSIKILKIFTGSSPLEKLAPRRQVFLCPRTAREQCSVVLSAVQTGPPWVQTQAELGAPPVWRLAQEDSPSLHCRRLHKKSFRGPLWNFDTLFLFN